MPAKLNGEKKLRREISLRILEGPIIVTLTADGLSFAAKGSRTPLYLSWTDAVLHSKLPESVPAKFYDRPLQFLTQQIQKSQRRKARTSPELTRALGYLLKRPA
jgi:hypothetical protein